MQYAPKPVFGWGSAQDPAGGAYDVSPNHWGGGHQNHNLPLDAFGVSIVRPRSSKPNPLCELDTPQLSNPTKHPGINRRDAASVIASMIRHLASASVFKPIVNTQANLFVILIV